MSSSEPTPLMKQFQELKEQAGQALLLFRMGDFYELFGEDAVIASKVLGLTLTSRDKGKENPLAMAGVPFHSVESYLQKLLQAGYKVAIGEQVEDPEEARKRGAKSIVRREIIRTLTPAVKFDSETREASFLAVAIAGSSSSQWSLVLLDAATGECRFAQSLPATQLLEALATHRVPHLLKVAEMPYPAEIGAGERLVEELPSNFLNPTQARKLLEAQYGVASLDAFLPDDECVRGLGILVHYTLKALHRERLEHLQPPRSLHARERMALGARTAQHLDLLPSAEGNPNLYSWLNTTATALGSRLLRQWILEPLADRAAILDRQTGVKELAQEFERASRMRQALSNVYDLDRLLGRISAGLANPRDTWALGQSLAASVDLGRVLVKFQSPSLKKLAEQLEQASPRLSQVAERVLSTQKEDAPFTARDGGVFRKGASPELDRLLDLAENGSRWLVELETRERQATGIPSLKVRYNRVFGYYIEVTTAHLKNVPSHYLRKQTTVGAERFFTEELKKFEEEILTAGARQTALEVQMFADLVSFLQNETPAIMALARVVAEADATLALARLMEKPGWVFPTFTAGTDLVIEAGRHPWVDESTGKFVPNSLNLRGGEREMLLITGPNMGGKSTVMRQAALIVILGQMGAPVPARSAEWGVVSSVHTRIGAHDAIARGQSTFMVEMIELAQILHTADHRSLIILDEIGRGTSTYDGMSVAWATVEWIARNIRARTLFATHYHELTTLPRELPSVANAHMAVENKKGGELRFLYELRDGPTSESFGIQVAALAGLPKPVIARAWQVLEQLEKQEQLGENVNHAQLSLFSSAPSVAVEPAKPDPRTEAALAIADALGGVDPNQMTPIQALTFLVQLREKQAESLTN